MAPGARAPVALAPQVSVIIWRLPTLPTVFIVDDEETVRSSLARLLRAIGYPVETFASAELFLDGYTSDGPACLLLDIRMPGMSGLDLIDELKRRAIHVPAIVMSGLIDENSLERLETMTTLGLLEKPFSLEQLKSALE